jgi:chromosome partitioning protein
MQAVMALAKHGKLAPTVIHDRTDFPTAAITGRTVTEIEQEGPSANEVREVLNYVRTQFRKPASTHTMKKVVNG